MILIGTKCRLEQTVTDALTAANVGSGALPVFGTPYMSALMENAAMTCLQSFLSVRSVNRPTCSVKMSN